MPDEKCGLNPKQDCYGLKRAEEVAGDVRVLDQRLTTFQQYRRTRNRKLVKAYIRPYDNYEEDIMTGKEIYDTLNDYLKKQPVPAWAKAELDEAVRLGITDGKEPMALIPRYQAAIMTKRAREGK